MSDKSPVLAIVAGGNNENVKVSHFSTLLGVDTKYKKSAKERLLILV
tara:strand:- start:133 stop:273 length:141 start_codon:yes stop_codon:yes gene_type:complete